MPPKDKEIPCGGCKKPLKGDSVQCNVCSLWFDMKCSGCDSDTATFLKSPAGKSSSIHWHCTSCENSSRRLHEMISAVNSRVELVEGKIDDLKEVVLCLDSKVEKRVDRLSGELTDVVNSFVDIKEAVSSLNKRLDNFENADSSSQWKVGPTIESQSYASKASTEMVSQVAGELKEREKRTLNVVFAGDITEEKVQQFVQAAKATKTSKVLEIKTKQNKTLYIVTMISENEKWGLIKKARTISQSVEGLQNIYVNPDLTKTERDVQFHLRQEVRDRRKLGENVKINKGKVVVVKNNS